MKFGICSFPGELNPGIVRFAIKKFVPKNVSLQYLFHACWR